ncbi:MAG TPA: DUF4234 domain-containing protein [Frankiaceae bacterium]|nr:DUF4234 domain-containing protein [Frankiaceae bacterium]
MTDMGHGPKGRPRGPWTGILLAVLTCGLYPFYWAYVTHNEIKQYSGVGVGGPLGLLIFFFGGVITMFLLPIEITEMTRRYGRQSTVSWRTGLWILLPLAGPLIWFLRVQRQLNDFWAAAP